MEKQEKIVTEKHQILSEYQNIFIESGASSDHPQHVFMEK